MMPDRTDLSAIAALLRDVARTIVMPRFGHIGPADLRTKSGPLDPVTVADEAAEDETAGWQTAGATDRHVEVGDTSGSGA